MPPLPNEIFVDILSCFDRRQLCRLQATCNLLRSLTQSHFSTHPRILSGHYSEEAFYWIRTFTRIKNKMNSSWIFTGNDAQRPLEVLVLFAGTQYQLDDFIESNPDHYVTSFKWRCLCLGDLKSPFPNTHLMTAKIAIFFHHFTDPSLLYVLSSFSHLDPLSSASASSRKIRDFNNLSSFHLLALKGDSTISCNVMEKLLTEIAFCECINIDFNCIKSLRSPFFAFPAVQQACNIGIGTDAFHGVHPDRKDGLTISIEDIANWIFTPPPPQPAYQQENTRKPLRIDFYLIDGNIPSLIRILLQRFQSDTTAVTHDSYLLISRIPVVEGVTDLTHMGMMNNREDHFKYFYIPNPKNTAQLSLSIRKSRL